MASSKFLTNDSFDHSIVSGLEDIASRLNIPQSDLDGLIRSALNEASIDRYESPSSSIFRYSYHLSHNPLSKTPISIDDPIITLGAEIFFADE